MTRKQRMYPESNRVKMSLKQDEIVESAHRSSKKVFVWKDGKRVYDESKFDNRRLYGEVSQYNENVMQSEKVSLSQEGRSVAKAAASATLNPKEPSAVPPEACEGQLYEWNTKQLILRFGSACNGCE